MKVLNKNDEYDYGLVEKVFDTVLPQDLSNELAIYDTSFLIFLVVFNMCDSRNDKRKPDKSGFLFYFK